MNFNPGFDTIAQAIQLAIAPVFMLAGIGALLNVLTGRLARIVNRARELEALHPSSTGPEHERHVWELRLIDRRITLINRGLALAVSSAVMVCLVVALMFIAGLVRFHLGVWVALCFIAAMALLTASLIVFLIEVRISLSALHIRAELLEHDT